MNGEQESDKKSSSTETDEYTGPDQRKFQRRESNDRREDIRFDLNNEDRRKNKGRRKEDKLFWD